MVKSNPAALSEKIILVTGAARSGKSEWAENLAIDSQKSVVYIATAMMLANDPEWQARISKHQQRRPKNWTTIVESNNLSALIEQGQPDSCLLIDSLGSWIAKFLDMKADSWQKTTDKLLFSLVNTNSTIIFVAEETGWGVVPAYKSGRLFRDRLGYLSRQIGTIADTTYLVVGGHVLNLSLLGTALPKIEEQA